MYGNTIYTDPKCNRLFEINLFYGDQIGAKKNPDIRVLKSIHELQIMVYPNEESFYMPVRD